MIQKKISVVTLLVLLLLTTKSAIHAQGLEDIIGESSNIDLNIIPPSPETAAFTKYVDLPLNLYIGAPSFNIPLYNIQMKQLSLPIALSYDASGLLVEDPASWVGAGWTLNPTGVISRTVRGSADEFNENGDNFFFNDNNIFFNQDGSVNRSNVEDCNYGNTNELPQDSYSIRLVDGEIDLQPDLFSYSFPGESGSFTFNYKRELVKITPSDYEIIEHPFDNNNFSCTRQGSPSCYKWKIRASNGVIYTFGYNDANEEIYSESWCSGSPDGGGGGDFSQNGWYLNEISLNGEWIRFNYNSFSRTYWGSSESYMERTTGNAMPQSRNIFCDIQTTATTPQLASIETSDGLLITFEVSARTDPGMPKLDKVTVKRDDVFITGYEFVTGYFSMNGPTKLKLSEVHQISENNTRLHSGHTFEYYSESSVPMSKKEREDPSFTGIDRYGYYNGASNSQTLIEYKGANRNPNIFFTANGSLKTIHYPTGGNTEIVYESRIAGLRVNKVTFDDPVTGKKLQKIYEYGDERFFTDYDQGPYETVFMDRIQDPELGCVWRIGEPVASAYNNYRAQPLKTMQTYGGSPLGYNSVKEYTVDASTNEQVGLTLYEFVNRAPISGGAFFPMVPQLPVSHYNGKIKREVAYKKQNDQWIPVTETLNDYQLIEFPENQVSTVALARRASWGCEVQPCGVWDFSEGQTILFDYYDLIPSWLRLDSTRQVTYDGSGNSIFETLTSYTYDLTKHHLPARISFEDSQGDTYYSLLDRDPVNPAFILKKESFKKVGVSEKQISGEQNIYHGKLLKNRKIWDREINGYVDFVDRQFADNAVIQVTERPPGGLSKSFVWGYNYQYPVAQVVGADYTTVKAALGGDTGLAALQTLDGQALRNALAPLKNHASLTGSQITTYTYDPLIGITSQTDPNGITIYYEYDDFNRLELVRDHEQNILKKYDYHYSGQND